MRRLSTVTVILPAHGRGDGSALVFRDLSVAAYALRARNVRLNVLVLADPGGDAAELASKAAVDYDLELQCRPAPADVGKAYLAGLRAVVEQDSADVVVTMDASGRHDPMQIPHLTDQLMAAGADVVIGSRWAKGSGTPGLSLPRWLRGRAASLAFRVLSQLDHGRDHQLPGGPPGGRQGVRPQPGRRREPTRRLHGADVLRRLLRGSWLSRGGGADHLPVRARRP